MVAAPNARSPALQRRAASLAELFCRQAGRNAVYQLGERLAVADA
jgi:hypothetical protein